MLPNARAASAAQSPMSASEALYTVGAITTTMRNKLLHCVNPESRHHACGGARTSHATPTIAAMTNHTPSGVRDSRKVSKGVRLDLRRLSSPPSPTSVMSQDNVDKRSSGTGRRAFSGIRT